MKIRYVGADIYENSGPIDWPQFEADFVFIRLNHIGGGHHMDEMFTRYWKDCPIPKAPYFVYNPWVTGRQNFEWMAQHMPIEAKGVMVDIEVEYSGRNPGEYSVHVQEFLAWCRDRGWTAKIYTGGGYRTLLSDWPTTVDYVWAWYPVTFYPAETQKRTWAQVWQQLLQDEWDPTIYAYDHIKPLINGWQFTGDKLIMPGVTKPLDLIAWNDDLTMFVGDPGPEDPTRIEEEILGGKAKIIHGQYVGDDNVRFDYHLTIIPKANVESMFVTSAPLYPRTTGYVADTRGVDILSNGGEALYNQSPALPKGQSVSLGVPAPIAPVEHRFLSMQWDKNMNFLGYKVAKDPYCYWAVGINDILVQSGQPAKTFDTEVEDPRSALFWNNEVWFFIHVDGRSNGRPGVKLRELAKFGWALGADEGGNLDGGGSSTLIVLENGQPVQKNIPPDGQQHGLADHIGFFIKENAPMPSEITGTVKTNTLGIFNKPRISAQPKGILHKGDIVTGSDEGKAGKFDWIKSDAGFVPRARYKKDGTKNHFLALEEPGIEPQTTFLVPDDGFYVQAVHDWDNPDWGRPRQIVLNFKKGGLPETVKLTSHPEFAPLSKAWQFWIFDLIKKCNPYLTPQEQMEAWISLTADGRSHFDDHAVQNGYIDYVRGINIGSPKGPIAIKTLAFGGNKYRLAQPGFYGTRYKIEALDATLFPPDLDDVLANKPWLIQYATEINLDFANPKDRTKWTVGRFPQIRPYAIALPIMKQGPIDVYIGRDHCHRLENGYTYSPFVPEYA